MFIESLMWLVFGGPVRLQITRELKKIPVLIQLAIRGFPLSLCLLISWALIGWLANWTNRESMLFLN